MSREYHLQPFQSATPLQIDYAHELNEQQLAAVKAPPGPALVIAGAGAGKTRTLIYRVAYLLEQGVPPERLLLLTFTNKAAKEMMRRVADLLGNDVTALWGGTFHSLGHRVLRRHAERVGCRTDFTILDREDAKELVNACLGETDIDVKATRFPKGNVLADIFSLAVNTHKSVPEILGESYNYFSHLAPQIQDVQARYAARKRATNVMDFDDLLVLWLRLLQENADVCEQYQRRFQFILVDEYQDTNRLQSDLIDLLAAHHHNLMVVGDDAQSIYSWRGANFHNILNFPKRYAEAKVYKIETNYRSSPEILHLANAAIAANVHQFDKELSPVRPSGARPALVVCGDAQVQAAFVAQRVLELREEGIELSRMAVLYRAHFHALELQFELTRRNIPFAITSGLRFFEQAHIKDIAAFIKLVCNPRDELAFKRLVKMLPGVGAKGADKLWGRFQTAFARSGTAPTPPPPSDTAAPDSQSPAASAQPAVDEAMPAALAACREAVPKKTLPLWPQFAETLRQLSAAPMRQKADTMIQLALEALYQDYLKETYPNYRARLDDIQQLAGFAHQFETPQEFLTQLALLSNVDADQATGAADRESQLNLSTIHQAKGLEFDVVFLIMLCDGLFPPARSLDSPERVEEERRLFYVGITRARNELYCCYPLIRMTAGYSGDLAQKPSRFLREVPMPLWDEWNLRTV